MLRRRSHPSRAVSVDVRLYDGRTVAAVGGAIDVATAPGVAEELRRVVRAGPVELDLSAVSFIDASGLRALRDLAAIASEHGHRISVLPLVGPGVARVMNALQLDLPALLRP